MSRDLFAKRLAQVLKHRWQFAQAAHFGIRGFVAFPVFAARVEPDGAQARLLGTGNVITGVIAHVHGRRRRNIPAATQRLVKQPRIRLGNANVFGAQHKLEVMPQANAAHVGIAIGHDAQGVVRGQRYQRRLSLRKHF